MELYKALHDQYPSSSTIDMQAALDGFTASKGAYGDGVIASGNTHNLTYCPDADRQQYGVAAWGKNGQGCAIINGTVQEIIHSPAGYLTTCPRVNSNWSSATGSHRWLHHVGSWAYYV